MNGVEKIMYDEAEREFQDLNGLELGSEKHAKATAAANSIVDRLNKSEEIKIRNRELDVKEAELEIEKQKLEMEESKSKNGNLLEKVKIGVEVGLAVLATGVTIFQLKSSQRFESDGYTHTTEAGRGAERRLSSLIDKFKRR